MAAPVTTATCPVRAPPVDALENRRIGTPSSRAAAMVVGFGGVGVQYGMFGLSEGDGGEGAAPSRCWRCARLFRARTTPGAPRHRARPVSAAPTAAPTTRSLPRSPTPPPAPRQQAPGGINCSHALEDGLGAQPALTGRRAARRRPLARPRLPSPARNGRPVAHSARLPVAPAAQSAPNPPAPPLSHTHLTGCRLVAGGSGQRHGSGTA